MCLGPFDAEEPEAGCVGMPGPRFTQYCATPTAPYDYGPIGQDQFPSTTLLCQLHTVQQQCMDLVAAHLPKSTQ